MKLGLPLERLPARGRSSVDPLWWQGATASAALHALAAALALAAGLWRRGDVWDPVTPYPPQRDFASISVPSPRRSAAEVSEENSASALEITPQVQVPRSEVLAPADTTFVRPQVSSQADSLPATAARSSPEVADRWTAPRITHEDRSTGSGEAQAMDQQTTDGLESAGAMSRASMGVDSKIAPRVLINPAPEYPREALVRRLSGTVLVQVAVDAQGAVAEAFVVRSSGVDSLDQSALQAVRRWRFLPARDPQTPLRRVRIPIEFLLRDAD